jgi:hypothetical protein
VHTRAIAVPGRNPKPLKEEPVLRSMSSPLPAWKATSHALRLFLGMAVPDLSTRVTKQAPRANQKNPYKEES